MAALPGSVDAIAPGCDPATLPDDAWPPEVAFLPYVGRRYKDGWNGHRVLLLGESHYRKEGRDDSASVTRQFTLKQFSDMASHDRSQRWGGFWDALDRLLLNQKDYDPVDAAVAWERVAYINQCQVLAGTASNHRPSYSAMRDGGDIHETHVLPILRPTVILVLGRFTWNMLRHGKHMPLIKPYKAADIRKNGRHRYKEIREVWTLGYKGGAAWMTWVYHPSWHIDTWEDRAGALRHLLELDEPSSTA